MAKHIIIIGAGLGGPCLALCLARRGISSTIYEIRPSPSLLGGSISLSANALKILDKYCGVYPRLRDTGYSYRQIGVYTDGGEKLGVVQAGDREDKEGGYAALRIMRSELQRVLVAACEESGRVKVKYGMKVRQGGIEEEAFGVRVQFEDGSEDHGMSITTPHLLRCILVVLVLMNRRPARRCRWDPFPNPRLRLGTQQHQTDI